MRAKLLRYTAIAIVSTSLVSACQTTNKYGYDYSADRCKVQRDNLLEQQDYFADDLIKGVLVGAAAGAALGALTAWATGGDAGTGAAIGAASGAVTGASAAYFNYVQKQSGNQSELLSTILLDMESDAERLARTQQALDALIACRTAEKNAIQADFDAGLIDAATARSRMATLNTKLNEDLRVARDINKNVSSRQANFEVAASQVGALPGRRPASSQASQPAVQVSAANQPKQEEIGRTYTTLEKRSVAVENSVSELATLQQETTEFGGFSTSWLSSPGLSEVAAAPACMPCSATAN
ncbi:glycine zipper domain-containing protein [Rhodospira trueperi]|uniref:Glycine zipper n=1 Tax=Rhodospira trueperi TaxID=69960 RepID=A0A1G7A9Q5_9PROT|nr:glycine zipper domain-containing protein [Rhodospira trueperi]SDE11227.1 hypothetical protein SAMN05421720_103229 [Rhodospira trueperi]